MSQPADKAFDQVEFGEELPEIPVDVSLDNVKVFAEAARGLHAAHERGLVHGDFKPDRI